MDVLLKEAENAVEGRERQHGARRPRAPRGRSPGRGRRSGARRTGRGRAWVNKNIFKKKNKNELKCKTKNDDEKRKMLNQGGRVGVQAIQTIRGL